MTRKPRGRRGPRYRYALAALLCLVALDARAATAPAKSEEPPPAPTSISVEIAKGRLTLNAVNAPLDEVLHDLGEKADIAIEARGDLGVRTTISLVDVPLEEGISRLLREQSFALSYKSSADGRRVSQIWVIARASAQPGAASGQVSTPAQVRSELQKVRELARRKDTAAIAELSAIARSDPNAIVRMQALRAVKNLKGRNAITDVQAALSTDADPAVRRNAARIGSEIPAPEVRWLLTQAQADGDASVRQEAEQALKQWEQRYGNRYGASGVTR